MNVIFTLCSNNYLSQALVLADSVALYQPGSVFVIGLVDRMDPSVNYSSFKARILPVEEIESRMDLLAAKFNIIELNTCVKPTYFQYFFEQWQVSTVAYLDPDICLYHNFSMLDQLLCDYDVLLTPHVLSPIDLDGLRPDEQLFLNYGIYNLGFLALKKTPNTLEMLKWWKKRTYELGYYKPSLGLFTDQLWMNFAHLYFEKVYTIRNRGFNMAPWNLHERRLGQDGSGNYMVNNSEPLVFYHFSSFKPGRKMLHREYTRFAYEARPDLHAIHQDYEKKLERFEFPKYSTIPPFFNIIRMEHLQLEVENRKLDERQRIASMPWSSRVVRQFKSLLPRSFKEFAMHLIKT